MRVFVPVTIGMLQSLVADGELRARSGTAFAVTPALRGAYVEGDDDELADVAIREAARASLRLLGGELGEAGDAAAERSVPVRRAVLAADVPDSEITLRPDLDDAVVRLSGPIPTARVASVHVDLAEAEPAVLRAVELVDAADLGDEDAELALGDAEDHELAWYATQELPFLLELL